MSDVKYVFHKIYTMCWLYAGRDSSLNPAPVRSDFERAPLECSNDASGCQQSESMLLSINHGVAVWGSLSQTHHASSLAGKAGGSLSYIISLQWTSNLLQNG